MADGPGNLVQLDTLFVNVALGKTFKHFTAHDPIAKWTVAKAINGATAASVLDRLLADMPIPVRAIQVDGGSAFMADFENACQAKKILLGILPPKFPKMNAAVERCNGAW